MDSWSPVRAKEGLVLGPGTEWGLNKLPRDEPPDETSDPPHPRTPRPDGRRRGSPSYGVGLCFLLSLTVTHSSWSRTYSSRSLVHTSGQKSFRTFPVPPSSLDESRTGPNGWSVVGPETRGSLWAERRGTWTYTRNHYSVPATRSLNN